MKEPRWVCLEGMNADELAAYDYGSAGCLDAVKRVLNGKDNGSGSCNEPWESVRRRLIELVEAEAECLEQARLNGMGSEREARLMTRLEKASAILKQARRVARHCVPAPGWVPDYDDLFGHIEVFLGEEKRVEDSSLPFKSAFSFSRCLTDAEISRVQSEGESAAIELGGVKVL